MAGVILSVASTGNVAPGGLKSDCGAADMKDDPKKRGASSGESEDEERRLDEALEESFPASDPLPTTGTSAGGPDEHKAKTPRERQSEKKGG